MRTAVADLVRTSMVDFISAAFAVASNASPFAHTFVQAGSDLSTGQPCKNAVSASRVSSVPQLGNAFHDTNSKRPRADSVVAGGVGSGMGSDKFVNDGSAQAAQGMQTLQLGGDAITCVSEASVFSGALAQPAKSAGPRHKNVKRKIEVIEKGSRARPDYLRVTIPFQLKIVWRRQWLGYFFRYF